MKNKIAALLVCFLLIPQVAFAVPDKLWSDDGTLDKIYGSSKVEETNVSTDIVQDLLRKINVLDEKLFSKNTNADLRDYVRVMSSICGRYMEEKSDEELLTILYESDISHFAVKKNKITLDDVLFSAVELTGYKSYSDYYGGYPSGVIKAADMAGLLKGIIYESNRSVTKGELAQIAYNILTVDPVTVSFSGNSMKLEEENENLLKSRFDVDLVRGVVSRVKESSIYETGFFVDDAIEIDNVKYAVVGNESLDGLLGRYVDAFVKDNNGDLEFLCAGVRENKNRIEEFYGRNLLQLSENYLEVEEEKNKRYKISDETRVVYNGIYAGNILSNVIENNVKNDTQITVIDNSNDGTYDVIIMKDYEHLIAMYDVGSSARLRFDNETEFRGKNYITAKTEDDNKVRVIKDGAEISYTDIKKGNIVSISKSLNTYGTTLTEIVVCDKAVSGKITEIKTDEYGNYVFVINDAEYIFAENYLDKCGYPNKIPLKEEIIAPKMGLSATFALSFDGRIANILLSSGINYGYVITSYVYNDDEPDDSEVDLKMLTETGEITKMPLDEYVYLYSAQSMSGTKLRRERIPDEIKSVSATEDKRTIIAYTVNGKGNIKNIYLPYDNINKAPGSVDYPLTHDYFSSTSYSNSRYYHGMLAMKYRMGSNVKLFMVPSFENKDKESQYKVVSADYYGIDHTYYGINLYGVNEYFMPSAAVVLDDGVTFQNSAPALIDKVITAINDDDEEVYRIYYWSEGKYSYIDTQSNDLISTEQSGWAAGITCDKLKFGDIIHFRTSDSKIDNFRVLLHDYNNAPYEIKNQNGQTLSAETEPTAFIYMYGEVSGMKDDVIIINTDKNTEKLSVSKMSNPNCYLIEGKTIEAITMPEIEKGDKIAVRKSYSGILDIYIYR